MDEVMKVRAWVTDRYVEAGRRTEIAHILRLELAAQTKLDRTVALLHDIIEDGLATLAEVAEALKRAGQLSELEIDDVIGSVEILTRRQAEGQTYEEYITGILESGNQRSARVKRLDLLDHLNPYNGRTLRPDQAERYLSALERLVNAGIEPRT